MQNNHHKLSQEYNQFAKLILHKQSQQFYNRSHSKMEASKYDNSSYQSFSFNLINHVVNQLEENQDRFSFQDSMSNLDQQLYNVYAAQNYRTNIVSRELYNQPRINSVKLTVPRQNSLTDNLLRSTLGCEDKLSKSYLQIVEQPNKRQSQQRKRRVEVAKKKYADTNTHKDFSANSKPFMNTVRFAIQRPVIDNEHESYLKTQLIFLQQPKGSSINTKQYFDKHSDMIAKKINQLGGMEDTIGRMEDSLSKNQVKSFRKKQILAGMNQQKRNMFSPQKSNFTGQNKLKESWLNRSKQMRQSFMSKFQIE